MDISRIKEIIQKTRIIAIMRGIPNSHLVPAVTALVEGGIRAVEITLDRIDAIDGIRELNENFGEHVAIGAGTVLATSQVKAVAAAGGKYIVSPNTDRDVIRQTKALKLLSIPGAMTPTEIVAARSAGADYIKLFPAASLGLEYFKALLSPLSDIPFIVVGGIGLDNVKVFLDAGAEGAGIGGKLADKQLIIQGGFDKLSSVAAEYIEKVTGNRTY